MSAILNHRVTVDRLREMFTYDENIGVITWRPESGSCKPVGAVAGCVKPNGYRKIKYAGQMLAAHRVAWALFHGKWPETMIDHINGDRADNRIINLREATATQNKANSRVIAKHGFKGVTFLKKSGRWQAQIYCGNREYLGAFDTPEEAHAVYFKRAQELFGEFARAS